MVEMAQPGRSFRPAMALLVFVALALSGALFTVTVAGEPRVGVLYGRVLDRSGAPVDGAFVTVPGVGEDNYQEVRTDAEGRWRAGQVPIGYHNITAVRRGFASGSVASGSLTEGSQLQTPDIILEDIRPYMDFSAYYPPSSAVGNKKGFYLRGQWKTESAPIIFRMYPVDFRDAYLREEGVQFIRQALQQRIESGEKPLHQWERTYTTSERDGYFHGEPATPVIDKPGTFAVVAQLGNIRAAEIVHFTNLALVSKRDETSLTCWVTDIRTGEPVEGASVELWGNRQPRGSSQTDSRGLARFDASPENDMRAITGKDGSMAMVSTYYYHDNYDASSLIYTDRPIYRPGHKVHFKGIFRSRLPGEFTVQAGKRVTFVLEDPQGKAIASVQQTTSAEGTADAQWDIPEEAELGGYRIRVDMDGKTTDARFAVEEYRKPEFLVGVDIPKETHVRGEKIQAKVRSNYYFGSPVANAEVTYVVYRSRWFFWDYDNEFEEWFDSPEFRGDYEWDYYGGYGEVVTEGRTRTDENGEISLEIDTSQEKELSQYSIEVSVVDPAMREVTSRASTIVAPADFRIQAQTDRYIAWPGKEIALNIEAVSWEGPPVASRALDIRVERREWKRSRETVIPVTSASVTTDAKGQAVYRFTPSQPGSFTFVISGKDVAGRETSQEAYVWVADDSQVEGDVFYYSPEETLSIKSDKKLYSRGESARFLITSKDPQGKLWLTVEGAKLFDSRIVNLSGGSAVVELPLEDAYLPNVTVAVTQVKNAQARTAQTGIGIAPADRFLTVKVTSSKEQYKPGETARYTIQTLDDKGNPAPAEVSFGVVDESIYALRPDSTPDIQKYFWGPRYNRVSTSNSLEGYYYGGAKETGQNAVRRDFKDTAFWDAAVKTDASGKAVVTFKWPDNLTTWRATARAVTRDTKVGSSIHKCRVTKDLIVRLQTPRFFRQRDRQELGLIVHNNTNADKQIRVSLEASGLRLRNGKTRTVTVKANGVERIVAPVEVVEPGTAVLTARAVAVDGSLRDAIELKFPVLPHGAREQALSRAGVLQQTDRFTFNLPNDPKASAASLVLELTPTSAGAALQAMQYLAEYPWGCVEQTVSSFVPAIVAQRAFQATGLGVGAYDEELPKKIALGVRRLGEMQNWDGSWSWYAEAEPDPGMTAYVLMALVEARRAGASVPDDMINRGASWLRARTNDPLPPRPSARDMVSSGAWYRSNLQTIAQVQMGAAYVKAASPSVWDAMWKRRTDLDSYSVAALGMAAYESGWQDRFQQAAGLLETRAKRSQGMLFWESSETYNYFTGQAATALALRVLKRAGNSADSLEPAVRWLLVNRQNGYWVSTRDTALVLLSLVEHVESVPVRSVGAQVIVNGKPAGSVAFDSANFYASPLRVSVPANLLNQGQNSIDLRLEGQGPLYFTASSSYFSSDEDLPAKPGYYRVVRKFYRVELSKDTSGQYSEKLTPLKGAVKAGEVLKMRIEVTPQGDSAYTIIECPLPSGFEVVEKDREWSWMYSGLQVRDNRVGIFNRSLSGKTAVFNFEVRPEISGDLHVMPVEVYAMYSPNLFGRSSEHSLEVR